MVATQGLQSVELIIEAVRLARSVEAVRLGLDLKILILNLIRGFVF